jgi:hypothetical protein
MQYIVMAECVPRVVVVPAFPRRPAASFPPSPSALPPPDPRAALPSLAATQEPAE